MILYLLLVLGKINWMFLPQVEHCGETKTEMRGMVSAEIYWTFTKKKQLFTSFLESLDQLFDTLALPCVGWRSNACSFCSPSSFYHAVKVKQQSGLIWISILSNTGFTQNPLMKKIWKAIAVSQIWYEGNINLDFCLQDWLLAFCESGRPLGGRRLASAPPGMEDYGRLFPLGSSYTQVITNISNMIIIMIILIQRRRFCPGSWLQSVWPLRLDRWASLKLDFGFHCCMDKSTFLKRIYKLERVLSVM